MRLTRLLLILGALALIALSQITLRRPLPATPVYAACTPPPAGMLAWWRAEGNATEFLSGTPGSAFGDAGFGAGMVGQAFELDGSGDYFTANGDFDLPEKFTIDAWIYPETLPTVGDAFIVDRVDQSALPDQLQASYRLNLRAGAVLEALVEGPSGPTLYESSSSAVVAGEWQHVAVTYDGTAGLGAKITFYVNGSDVGSGALGTLDNGGVPSDLDLGDPTFIGSSSAHPEEFEFNGLIDEVEFFGRVLSEAEIDAIHDAGPDGKCLPPPDADADGVLDEDDICPDTAAGQRPVTSKGCSEADLGLTRPARCLQGPNAYNNLIVGTNGANNLAGPNGSNNLIYGLGGNDNITDGSGLGCLVGGAGNDNLSGGNGMDVLVGGSGTDKGVGGAGYDFCGLDVEVRTQCEATF